MFDKKWRNVMAFALGLPTAIFSISLCLRVAVDSGLLSKRISNVVLVAFLAQCVAVLVLYAVRKKN
ncbi:MAG: hypothetical protein A2X86_05080 [Bdellovibrionales bacterium GWA2_49_15]|nr:MAG: hypothetical protein A2X86_05080 [Bdellovibrionales bacterium GWA2_49_15]